MKKIIRLLFVFSIPLLVLLLSNCRKEQFGNASISFGTDTLTFDTVFTSLGSTTKSFKVFNTDKKAVRISDIRLLRLVGTQFKIQVDGVNGDQFTDIEIPAKDSIYIHVEVTVNPTDKSNPFVIIDDISFLINGNTKTVHLQAFGQNAHFHYGEEITGTKYWTNDLPHVVISRDTVPGVYVRCGASLVINPGCKIFFANNSAIFVEGNLQAEASNWNDSIVFQGLRLEQFYEDKPGQWFGITFLRNSSCKPTGTFNHCIINESSYGIYAGASAEFTTINSFLGTSNRANVFMENTIVKNSQFNAVYGFNAEIEAENSIFYAAGDYLVNLALGGDYKFKNCTLFNNGSKFVSHEKEALFLGNFAINSADSVFAEPIRSVFTNCVIYGSLKNEVSFNNIQDFNLALFDNSFSYCNIKSQADTFNLFTTVHIDNIFNQDPAFKKPEEGNFTPIAGSPLLDKCPSGLMLDIFATSRNNPSDIGAVELP